MTARFLGNAAAELAERALSSPDGLENRLEFEMLLADLSSRFINISPAAVDSEIERALSRICEPLGVDIAVLWQWSAVDPKLIVPTHAYWAEEGWRPSEPLHQDLYPWVVQQILAGRTVVIPSIEGMPTEAAVDRANALELGLKSSLCLPLSPGGEQPIGVLAFNTVREEHDWPDSLVKRLELVAHVFTNALARTRADQALREREEVNRITFDQAAVGIAHVGADGRWLRVNDRLCAIVGHPREELLRSTCQDITYPEDLDASLSRVRQILSGEIDNCSMEKRFVRKDCSLVWVNLTISLVRDPAGKPRHLITVVEDFTERKRAEDAMRGLSRRLIQAQEKERALLARELHDDLTQRLAVLAIDVGKAELAASDGAQAGAMRTVRERLVGLSEDVHALAYQLHPSVLEELGLAEALRAECERLGRRAPIGLSATLPPLPDAVPRDTALCLFRVAQEALTNVIRHSHAHAATVDLRPMDGGLLLSVRDDGVGFDRSRTNGRSLGLASMRERVQLLNGTLEVESAPGQGTAVVAWIPLEGGIR